jgi:hypothetical protein
MKKRATTAPATGRAVAEQERSQSDLVRVETEDRGSGYEEVLFKKAGTVMSCPASGSVEAFDSTRLERR